MNAASEERPLRVVIVDDTPELRDLMRLSLEGGGFDVVAEASDGRQGIEVSQEQRPDVILLDLAMPVMDGLEALPTLRQVCPDAKIIVLSGFGAARITRRALAAGADGYLQKGVPLKTILGYVRDLTDDTRPSPPPAVTVTIPPQPDASPDLPDAVRLAPNAVIELLDEPVYRVVGANRAAVELLGHPCPPGTPLFSVMPALASLLTRHRGDDEAALELELPGGRVSTLLRRNGLGRVYLYLAPGDDALLVEVAGTAHELRGQISALLGMVEALADSGVGSHHPDQARMLEAIGRQASVMDSITADLLAVARHRRTSPTAAREAIEP